MRRRELSTTADLGVLTLLPYLLATFAGSLKIRCSLFYFIRSRLALGELDL
jgi:hypothetical protein